MVADAFKDDNSFYSPATRKIKYGSGGVDDAEDADVITARVRPLDPGRPGPAGSGPAHRPAIDSARASATSGAAVMSALSPERPAADVCIFDWDGVAGEVRPRRRTAVRGGGADSSTDPAGRPDQLPVRASTASARSGRRPDGPAADQELRDRRRDRRQTCSPPSSCLRRQRAASTTARRRRCVEADTGHRPAAPTSARSAPRCEGDQPRRSAASPWSAWSAPTGGPRASPTGRQEKIDPPVSGRGNTGGSLGSDWPTFTRRGGVGGVLDGWVVSSKRKV